MRNSPLKGLARKGNSQGLKPQALKDKRRRDVEAASKQERIDRRGENHKLGQSSNYDIHHKSDGSTEKISVASNRDVWKRNERT